MSPASVPAVKLVAFLKRKPGTSMQDFEEYYEKHHVPLVLSVTPSISRYVRNYVKPDSTFNNLDSLSSSVCDVVTEAWFETEEDFAKFQADASTPEAREKIIKDEMNFLDRESIRMFLVKECVGNTSTTR
ncbi:hypothetical protein CLAIMM_05672 [Cladophialophora immunda]|nr:hypothetical protein CLAIMM_05672 [Cladophialophora immunda]